MYTYYIDSAQLMVGLDLRGFFQHKLLYKSVKH